MGPAEEEVPEPVEPEPKTEEKPADAPSWPPDVEIKEDEQSRLAAGLDLSPAEVSFGDDSKESSEDD